MEGKLTGIGVGPGDPELLTLKAVRAITESDILILPGRSRDDCYAYRIVQKALPEVAEKEFMLADFPMTKNKEVLKAAWEKTAEEICRLIDEGKKVSFLTIGDPSIYATYHYIHRLTEQRGKKAEMISGVPSFCSAAARLGISLGDGEEQIHIIPGSYGVEETTAFSGTRIYMKSGRELQHVKKVLKEEAACREKNGEELQVYAVADCGLENEMVMRGLEEWPEKLPYLTIVIVKVRKI